MARRNDMEDQWQLPQGGIDEGEQPHQAMHRELEEELGVTESAVTTLAQTKSFLRYQFPMTVTDSNSISRHYQGQELLFFLLRFHGSDSLIDVCGVEHAEFDRWSWVDYWNPVETIVEFKRDMYRSALLELQPFLFIKE